MTLLKRFGYIPAAILLLIGFNSCDDDFTSIGGELIGGQIDNFPKYEAGVVAYNKNLTAVQTNNLPAYLLGVYQEPVYGQMTANILTQLSLANNSPTFGRTPRLDSVVMTVPYFSTQLPNNEQGNTVYRIDSLYGNSPYKLSIFRSNLFLNDFDPEADFETRQKYYSDQGPFFENFIANEPLLVIPSFVPSSRQVKYLGENSTGAIDTIRKGPRLRVQLPVQFFKETIIDNEGTTILSNNNNFKNFLKGLYFKAEPINGAGNMLLLDYTSEDAGIVLYYTSFPEEGDEDGEQGTFKLNFGNSIVNTFNQDLPTGIVEEITGSDSRPGAENLYLKGGEGSMAIIELFEDDAEIEEIRANNWLINEANLTFTVNRSLAPAGPQEPQRVLLYNLKTNDVLLDYRLDPTSQSPDPAGAVINHSIPLVRGEDGYGTQYKIRITEHVRRIIAEDQENVKLGLVVIQNIQATGAVAIKNPSEEGVKRIPAGTVITPRGTVLYGNRAAEASNRVKFNIYYSETGN